MRITHVVWDWNGTLLDDLEVCHGIINAMLERRGRPALSLEAYRQVQEFPVVNYYAKIFDLEAESFHDLAEEYMARYNRLWEHCGLTTGALETLSALRMAGVGQSMLTASRGDNLHRQLEHYGLQEAFSPVSTLEDHYAGGKAHLGRDHMAQLGLPPEEVVMVGDTCHDAEVAAAMGCRCVLVACGHQTRARLEATGRQVLAHPLELLCWIRQG